MDKTWVYAALFGCLVGVNSMAASQPNVVVILTDDQGFQDVGCYGSPLIKTPNLDQMAKDGCRFTSFYAASFICTPSRAGLMTGRYPQRIGVNGVFFPDDKTGLPLSEVTLGDVLKKQGYVTGCIGKWHLGHLPEYLPTARGFDSFYGIPYSNDMGLDPQHIKPSKMIVLREGKTLDDYNRMDPQARWPLPPLMRGTECVEWPADQDTLTKRYTEEAVSFIRQNRKKQFFLFYAPAMPHTPLHASKAFRGKSKQGLYGDAVEEIDWAVGELLDTLKAENLETNTIVFFTSDNGPALYSGPENAGCADPLRGGKCTTYEGGLRVPCIVCWPGTIPAGTVCDQTACALDIFPTVAALSGAQLPGDLVLDGHNILPLMKNVSVEKSPWDAFYYGFEAVRVGDWKYRQGPLNSAAYRNSDNTRVFQLFNLSNDIGETNNLIDLYPEKVHILKEKVQDFGKAHWRPVARSRSPDEKDAKDAGRCQKAVRLHRTSL